MSGDHFQPTLEQQDIIRHDGSAFVCACPGAGKTRVMVERAYHLFQKMPPGRGIAFLSFTRSAISELETRLRERTVLPSPAFPSFIGTFDSFIWQFLVAPFGLPGSNARPRLIPDVHNLEVKPFNGAQALPLSCFDPSTAVIDEAEANRLGFDTAMKTEAQLRAYSTQATKLRARLCEQGQAGFDEARTVALDRLNDPAFAPRLTTALSGRFYEVIVDEAQDCNPDDLKIISLLRNAGLPIKIICDPHQSIYGFRGGVTDQLFAFANDFEERDRKSLSGNFRSSRNICNAIAMLRPPSAQEEADKPLGIVESRASHVYVISYSGTAVSPLIGEAFSDLVRKIGKDISECPVLAATKESGAAAVGQSRAQSKADTTFRMAKAVMDFHFASGFQNMKAAIEDAHRVLLEVQGLLSTTSYHQYLSDNEIDPVTWRPLLIGILRKLRFDPTVFRDARTWHARAKEIIAPHVTLEKGFSLAQKLKWNAHIEIMMSEIPKGNARARTIHSVKGMEFPAVCVVTTTRLKGVLDFLETGSPSERAEDSRKLYVAASRAQLLLVFATPKSQAKRFVSHLQERGTEVTKCEI